MRGFLTSSPGLSPAVASSIGVACAAALALPLALPTPAAAAGRSAHDSAPARPAGTGLPAGAAVPGSTRSLPLVPLTRDRVLGTAPEQGLYRAGVARFSLVGVVWDDPDAELHGRVQVRTRSTVTGKWSGWQDVETHNGEHGADPGTAERTSRHVRGATAPLWVGDSDGVDLRVRADLAGDAGARTGKGGGPWLVLPSGLRLELVDPGQEAPPLGPPADASRTGPDTDEAIATSAANTDITGFGAREIPALSRWATERELARLQGSAWAKPYVGARPKIVTRRGWGADESLRERGFVYTKKVKAAFVHHTASGNKYTCAQSPSVIRGIYRYHVKSMGWRDIGYNFLVDKCGSIYEGRAGGVTKAVLGAHTLGFNSNSMGIAVIGTYGASKPSGAAVTGIARLTAWKLGLFGADPRAKTYLTSGGGNLYPKGKNVRLHVISGHRDGFATDCPGKSLYAKLGTARSSAARYQGR
ncbi:MULTISPECIES: peptidoglycan recognition protein family protein [Streptomyces]|uniref:Peptidoglycan recognition protein n=2 Tax=Streptomyces TaxID=1883 RepID=A0ABY6EPQ6_9ACTN|nr:peptidoglycan recognition protein [Streptomyces sp. HUAS 14-6]UXY36218.1 peptidoglycan recognition protein [Streptomyces sp. HUAS 14-6]